MGLMRVIVSFYAVAVFLQPVLAGQFLAGNFDMVAVHNANGTLILLLTVLTTVAAILQWRPGRGPAWPVLACAALFPITGLQIGMGHARSLAVHIPLGVSLVLIAMVLLVWVWLPRRPATREEH